jgi:hypothetical protein
VPTGWRHCRACGYPARCGLRQFRQQHQNYFVPLPHPLNVRRSLRQQLDSNSTIATDTKTDASVYTDTEADSLLSRGNGGLGNVTAAAYSKARKHFLSSRRHLAMGYIRGSRKSVELRPWCNGRISPLVANGLGFESQSDLFAPQNYFCTAVRIRVFNLNPS